MPKIPVNEDCAKYWRASRPSDDEDVKLMAAAQKFLDEELIVVKDRIIKAEEEKLQLEEQIRTVSAQAQAASAAARASQGSVASLPTAAPPVHTSARGPTTTTTTTTSIGISAVGGVTTVAPSGKSSAAFKGDAIGRSVGKTKKTKSTSQSGGASKKSKIT